LLPDLLNYIFPALESCRRYFKGHGTAITLLPEAAKYSGKIYDTLSQREMEVILNRVSAAVIMQVDMPDALEPAVGKFIRSVSCCQKLTVADIKCHPQSFNCGKDRGKV